LSLTAPQRVDITQSVALETIVALLQARLGLTEATCFEVESADDIPPLPPGGDYWLTIAADEGTFPPEEQTPGNPLTGTPGNLTEQGGFIVSGFTRIQLDQTGHAKKLHHDTRRGLLTIKHRILSALIGIDPVTSENLAFVRQTLYVTRASRPSVWKHPDSGLTIGMIQLFFGLDWDWSLTTAPEES
jgi:hypothetical protein